ncbi:MAG: FMN-binding protein [Firmicutes bacterium]|nr:FMN-binding protein [Bacillota bacterium]
MTSIKRISWIRILIALLAVCTAFGLMIQTDTVSAAEDEAADGPYYYDGSYQGTAYGYRSDVTVEITIADHEIADITVVSQAEDAAYWKKAVKILAAIKETKSLEVDTISGATVSSTAILDAAKAALDQALSDPASPFVSGDGSEASPYTIVTAAKLAQFAQTVDEGETYAGKIVVLGDDMDLSDVKNWNPIGQEADKATAVFDGIFDAQGHAVIGMKISGKYSDKANLGLFAALGKDAQILNLTVQDAQINVKGNDVLRAGIIAGDVNGGGAVIDSCAATGSINVTSSGAALVYGGGLAGRVGNNTVITNNWTEVAIDAASQGGNNSAYAGGLYGTGGNNMVAVNNASFGEENASAPASTNFGGMAGGLSAMMTGYVYNNYAVGPASIVSGNSAHTWVGALAGQVTTSGMTKDADNVYQYPEAGPLRANNYFAQDAALSATKAGKAAAVATAAAGTGTAPYDTYFTGTPLTLADMASADFADTMNDTLVETAGLLAAHGIEGVSLKTWVADGGYAIPTGSVYSGAAGKTEAGDPIFASGKGTKKNPYVIETADQLRAFAASVTAGNNYAKSYIQLGADIDLSAAEWDPIKGKIFAGSFDGAGHTIHGLTIGTDQKPYELTEATGNYIGFFSRLGSGAVVRNVAFTDVYINVASDRGLMTGALAGYSAQGIIDGCSASGIVQTSCSKGNAFVGGLIGRNDAGAVINSWTGGTVVCEDTAAWVETGAIAGMNNSGLIANSYSLNSVEAKTGADNGGYSMGSLIAGYQGGDVVNCYAAGNLTTNDKTEYSGILAGWMRGYARTYNCWYNKDQTMTMAGQIVDPATIIGIWPVAYTDDEGLFYIGGLAEGLNEYRASNAAALADSLNAGLEECPINIEDYDLGLNALKKWTVSDGTAVLGEETADYSYMRPDWEEVPQKEVSYNSGIWYGRSDDESTVVALTISDNEVTKVEMIEGAASGDAYDEAVTKAKEKAMYGDTSTYEEADPSMFAGGSGTQEDPYQIANEVQLRYLANSINEDVDWEGVYFRQTANIKLSKADWTPIGWGIMAEIKSSPTIYAQYPFRGSFDGAGYTITGLTIGSEEHPSADPRVSLATGLFGILEGDEQTNDTPQDPETRYVELTGIHLEDVSIHVKAAYDNYAGALAGDPELGFRAIDCSAEGTIQTEAENGSIYMGGLMGYPLRGLIQNCWSNMELTGNASDTAYVGGLCGLDNRVTTVNSFALGTVAANGKSIYAGGLSGDFAGFRHNCYTAVKVAAGSDTDYIGAVNGMASGIAAESGVYYSEKAGLSVKGEAVETKASGYSAGSQNQNVETPQADMGQALCDVLNGNIEGAYEALVKLHTDFGSINHHGHGMYYADETNQSLNKWGINGMQAVSFTDAAVTPGSSVLNVISAVTDTEKLTAEDAAAVAAAEKAYAALTDEQKAVLPKGTEEALKAAREKVDQLQKQAAEDAAAAAAAEAQLLAADTKDAAASAAAAAAYEALTDAQKSYVSDEAKNAYNAAALTAAKAQLAGSSDNTALQKKVDELTVRAQTVVKVKAKAKKGKKAKVSWKSLGAGYTYEVYRSTKLNKGFKKVSTTTKTKLTVKKLKAKKTYYVKVRAFKTVNGKKVYTGYSDVTSFKAKK